MVEKRMRGGLRGTFAAQPAPSSEIGQRHGLAMAARAAFLALVLSSGSSHAVLADPAQVAPAAQSFHLGGFKLWALRDAQNVLDNDGKVIGVEAGPEAVSATLAQAGAPVDKVTLDIGALLVCTPTRLMLFDTGLGLAVHGALLGSLSQAGFSPDDVTDVFLTHTHFDHVGGLTSSGRLTFPWAIIHMSAKEWAWMQSEPANRDLVRLIGPRVRPFVPGGALLPGVRAVALYGHTPGHVGYDIRSGRAHLLDVGDVVHSPVISLRKPDWAIGYDADRTLGETTRRHTLSHLVKTQEWVFAPHFPFPGVGRIRATTDGFAWAPGLPQGGGKCAYTAQKGRQLSSELPELWIPYLQYRP